MSDLENTRVQVYTVNFVNQTIHRHTEYTSIMWVSRYCLDIFLNHHLWLEGQYNLCMDQQEVTLEAKRGNYIFIKTWKRNVQSNHMDMVILSQPKVPVFLMHKKWIMFNSTFCVQLKVNYWLSEEVGGSPRLGRLALKMFRMQTCSSTLASMLQVQYIGFSCFFIKQSSTCFHVHCQWKWWEIFLVSAILTFIYLSSSYIGMNEF